MSLFDNISRMPLSRNLSLAVGGSWEQAKIIIQVLFIISFSFISFQCGLDVEDPTPPDPPQWIPKSLPEEWPERGIDAHESGGIQLEWNASLDEDIVAYHIYRATYSAITDTIGNFSHLIQVEAGERHVYHYIDETVTRNIRYYFKLMAEDIAGNMSNCSDSIYYTAKGTINPNSMIPNGTTAALPLDRTVLWHNYYLNEMSDYCLTILSEEGDLVTRNLLQPKNYLNGDEYWELPDTIVLEPGGIYKWRVDTGCDYRKGLETGGSESPWAVFHYLEN